MGKLNRKAEVRCLRVTNAVMEWHNEHYKFFRNKYGKNILSLCCIAWPKSNIWPKLRFLNKKGSKNFL